MTNKLFILVALIFLLCSCDPECQIRYAVRNSSSDTLNLSIDPPGGAGLGASYDLMPDKEVTIFAVQSMGYASDVVTYKKMNPEFLNCLTLHGKLDARQTKIRDQSAWNRENVGDTIALYRFIIKGDR